MPPKVFSRDSTNAAVKPRSAGLPPAVVAVCLVLAVLVIVGVVFWMSREPAAIAGMPPGAVDDTSTTAGATRRKPPSPMDEQRGPSPDQLRQIQEWKRQNPGAFTRY